ncbi:MAG: HAMP domain-containing protein [Rhizobiales bacterium]|nr:HAMP domain-containing protein [Hyphomicrobiales bacterium]
MERARGLSQLVGNLHRPPLHIVEFERGDDEEGLSKAQAVIDDTLSAAEKMAAAEATSSITLMVKSLRDYQDALDGYAHLYEENERRQAVMAKTTHQIEAMAQQIYDLNHDRYLTGLFILEDLERQGESRFTLLAGANTLLHATLSARQAEAEFQLDPNAAAREQATSFMKAIYLSALSLRKAAEAAGEGGEQIEALSAGVKDYRRHFGAFIEAVDGGSNVVEAKRTLDDTARKVQSLAEAIAQHQTEVFASISEQARKARSKVSNAIAALTQSMSLKATLLHLQDTEEEFFERRDPALGLRIEATINAADEALATIADQAQDDSALVQQTRDLLPGYRAAFTAAKAASLGQAAALTAMHDLEAVVLKLASDNASEAAGDMASLYEWGRLTLAAFCMIALVVGATISILTGRSIVRPLKTLTSSIADLARGDAAVTIPELDRTDEIGDMARSMGVIRETGTTALRAQKTLENTEACLMMVDSEGRVVHVNPAFHDLANSVRGAVGGSSRALPLRRLMVSPWTRFTMIRHCSRSGGFGSRSRWPL